MRFETDILTFELNCVLRRLFNFVSTRHNFLIYLFQLNIELDDFVDQVPLDCAHRDGHQARGVRYANSLCRIHYSGTDAN